MAEKSKTNHDSENKITNYKCKKKKKQLRKHYNKSENTTTNQTNQKRGLGIDYSPLTGRDICQSRCTGRTRRRTAVNLYISFSGADEKSRDIPSIWRDRPGFFCQTFFSLFKYRIVKAFIFNRNQGNNQKAENKASVRVGVWRALLFIVGGINLIIWIKMIIYTQYVIIAYCFIM